MDIDQNLIEQYVLMQDKKQFLTNLISNSKEFYFFQIIETLTSLENIDIKQLEEVKELIEESSSLSFQSKKMLNLLSHLKIFSQEQSTKQKQKTLHDISKLFDCDYQENIQQQIQSNQNMEIESQKLECSLNPMLINTKYLLQLTLQNNKTDNLSNNIFNLINFDQIENNYKNILKLVENKDILVSDQTWINNLPTNLKNLTKQQKEQIQQTIFQKVTLQQMEILALNKDILKLNNFLYNLFIKKFGLRLEIYTQKNQIQTKDLTEYLDLLLEIYQWLQNYKKILPDIIQFESKTLYTILLYCIRLEKFQQKYFNLFMENSFYLYYNFPSRYLKKNDKMPKKNEMNKFTQFKFWLYDIQENNFLDQCLSFILLDSYYDKYFEKSYLDFIRAKKLSEEGKQLDTTNLDPDIEQFIRSQEISLSVQNERFFSYEDEVILYLYLKNVSEIQVHFYEINSENYYLDKKQHFDSDINLDGLISIDSQIIQYPELRCGEKKKYQFNFSKFKDRRGIFVIEFRGQSVVSRAVIQKGYLICIVNLNIAGYVIQIYDENLQLCIPNENNHTGIILEGKFIHAEIDGSILIPFQYQDKKDCPIILVHNDFADFKKIDLISEQYEFNCYFHAQNENFLRDGQAKVIVSPKLYMLGQLIDIRIMKDCKINVTVTYPKEIKKTFSFCKQFDLREDILIEFPVNQNIQSVQMSAEGTIKYQLNSKQNTFRKDKLFDFFQIQNQFQLTHVYMKIDSSRGYVIRIVSKDGSPRKNIITSVNIQNQYFKDTLKFNLETNSLGEIELGFLPDCTEFKIDLSQSGLMMEDQINNWSFPIDSNSQVDFPSTLVIQENENIILPFKDQEFQLYKYHNNQIINDFNQKYNYGQIKGLEQGDYVLNLLQSMQKIKIKVVKGKIIGNHSYIFDYQINQIQQLYFVPNVCELQIIDVKTDNQNLQLQFSQVHSTIQDETLRVHIIGHNVLDQILAEDIGCMRSQHDYQTQQFSDLKRFSYASKRSNYLSNKILSDEAHYCNERKNQQKYFSLNVDKPSLFLKKSFYQETYNVEENLSPEKGYQQQSSVIQQLQELQKTSTYNECFRSLGGNKRGRGRGRKSLGCARKQLATKSARKRKHPIEDDSNSYSSQLIKNFQSQTYTNLFDFIPYNSCLYINQKIDKEGRIIIENFPLKKYQMVSIFCLSTNHQVVKTYPLPLNSFYEQKMRNMKLSKELQAEVGYFERRDCNTIDSQQNYILNQQSQKLIVSSFNQVFDIIQDHLLNGQDKQKIMQWSYLKDWQNLNQEQKNEKYSDMACHDFNLFIFFKDKIFFDTVVQIHLKNKIQKQFIDYFLLQDSNSLQFYYDNISAYNNLNILEQCLFIYYLQLSGKKDAANRLFIQIENQFKNQKFDINDKQRIFDSILEINQKKKENENIQDQDEEEEECSSQSNMKQNRSISRNMSERSRSRSIQKNNQDKIYSPLSQIMQEENNLMTNTNELKFLQKKAYNAINFNELELLTQKRWEIQKGFDNIEKTKQYIEKSYFEIEGNQQSIQLYFNAFWYDLASHIIKTGELMNFVSHNFIYHCSSLTSALAILYLQDLNFDQDHVQIFKNENEINIFNNSNKSVLLFHKNICPTDNQKFIHEIFVNQTLFDPFDETEKLDDQLEVIKEVNEFIVDKIYGVSTTVTNCSRATIDLQVLTQVPTNSIPLNNQFIEVNNYIFKSSQSKTIKNYFYFPLSGSSSIYPASVSRKQSLVSRAKSLNLINVKLQKKQIINENLKDLVRKQNQKGILQYLKSHNDLVPLSQIKEQFPLTEQNYNNFYNELIYLCKEKHQWDDELWKTQTFRNLDLDLFIELFNSCQFQKDIAQKFSLSYFKFNNILMDQFKFFEFFPILKQRAHNFMGIQSRQNNILNIQQKQVYTQFLLHLAQKRKIQNEDLIMFCYYLIIQDRISETKQLFQQIQKNQIQFIIQYDYLEAYLDLIEGYPNFFKSREIVLKYQQYPVSNWRNLFLDIQNQLIEYDGGEIFGQEIKEKQIGKNIITASKEQVFKIAITDNIISITYEYIDLLYIDFYCIDVEILFSRNPFFVENGRNQQEFSFIQSNSREIVEFIDDKGTKQIPIPQKLNKNNLIIRIKSNNQMDFATYFNWQLILKIKSNYGLFTVENKQGQPVSKVYVKVYSKLLNKKEVIFYRDGYTDMCGRFDYAMSSNYDVTTIESFSILIQSEEYGSMIKCVKPPSEVNTYKQDTRNQFLKRTQQMLEQIEIDDNESKKKKIKL